MRHTAIHTIRRPVDNAFLVRERDRRLLIDLLIGLVAVLVLGGGLLAYTWVHIETLRTGYRIDDLERELNRLEEQERLLRLDAASEAHPERIAQRAVDELGLEAPRLEQTLFFEQATLGQATLGQATLRQTTEASPEPSP